MKPIQLIAFILSFLAVMVSIYTATINNQTQRTLELMRRIDSGNFRGIDYHPTIAGGQSSKLERIQFEDDEWKAWKNDYKSRHPDSQVVFSNRPTGGWVRQVDSLEQVIGRGRLMPIAELYPGQLADSYTWVIPDSCAICNEVICLWYSDLGNDRGIIPEPSHHGEWFHIEAKDYDHKAKPKPEKRR